MFNYRLSLLLSFLICVSSCVRETENDPSNASNGGETFAQLEIPADFDFSTSKSVHLKVLSTNFSNNSLYTVYFLDDNNNRVKINTGYSIDGGIYETKLDIPSYVDELRVVKVAAELEWEKSISINSEYAFIEFDIDTPPTKTFHRVLPEESTSRTKNSSCEDYLVATNGQGKSFTIHQEDQYSITEYPNIESNSWAMAYDQDNNIMYYDVAGKLYKRTLGESTSTLITSIATSSTGLNNGYPRMTLKDGKIYIGDGGSYAILDATTGSVLKNITVTNFPSNKNNGGDLVFDSNGDLYQACSGGLYRLEMNADTTVFNAVRISADNFPYYLTGIAIDRFDNIYASSNDSNSRIIKLDKQDGSYVIVNTLNRRCNDLAAFICSDDDFAGQDSDGDGISDGFDEYPNDPALAFNNYYPGSNGFGTYAFEDLYPAVGDYDFNDVIVNYRHNFITNANNMVVKMESKYIAKSVNASLNSGFGIELPILLDSITSVTGSTLSTGMVSLNGKGTETGIPDSKPVIIVFDNQNAIVSGSDIKTSGEMDMTTTFTQPITTSYLNFENFNPFIFAHERSREIHLSGKSATTKFDSEFINKGADVGGFKSSTNHPWGLSISHTFHPPKENVDITNAYNNFSGFATSGGTSKRNWYTDDSGNRNVDKIHLDN
ncbi:LruC domain-containing protein [Flammeovirga sp. MY04]|uniref:LruC domain-containing protein n=1 Tax=Flammeovirga sp. MY04 TaxID=1191459 RepID=UPI0008062B5E|nr:LruC domain-containing protein [Flammeovirga sp. MY04]ANQ50517.1 LruC domain-containing protein [Flammeovirga sp. MY04]